MTDDALFRNEARKRGYFSRREFGGAGATGAKGAADNGDGRAAAVPSAAVSAVAGGTVTATDGIMFEWGGGGKVLILVAG